MTVENFLEVEFPRHSVKVIATGNFIPYPSQNAIQNWPNNVISQADDFALEHRTPQFVL